MKLISIIALNIFILTTESYKIKPYQSISCLPIIFLQNRQAIFLDLDGNLDEDLKTCLLKTVVWDQPVLLISGYNSESHRLLLKHKTTTMPNIVIMTKNIDSGVLDTPSIKRVLKSHRSIVYFVISDDKRFNCTGGSMKKKDFWELEIFLNDIWHIYKIMYINVIFPVSCPNKIAVYDGKKNKDQIYYDRTITLLDYDQIYLIYNDITRGKNPLIEDFPLRVNIFNRFPTSIYECENMHYYYSKFDFNLTQGFCGLDALVMHDIVKHFKFKLFQSKNKNCYKYGYASPGNITGSLGCIIRNELDVSFNSRFMTMYSEDYVHFLYFVTTDSLCAMVKRADVRPLWHYAVTIFNVYLWCLIISATIAIGIIMWALATVNHKMTGTQRKSLYFYIKDSVTSLMFGMSLQKKHKLYILRGTCLCCSIMFLAIDQGHINKVFTTIERYEQIKTLDQLYKSDKILYMSPSMHGLMKQLEEPEDELQKEFIKRAKVINEHYLLDFIVQNPSAAVLGRKQDSRIEILKLLTDSQDTPLIQIVDECFYTYYLSYIVKSGFLFFEELQRFIMHLREAGMPVIYYRWTCNMLRVPQTIPQLRSEPRPFQKITLENQRVAFGILILGLTMSIIVFVVEVWKGRRNGP